MSLPEPIVAAIKALSPDRLFHRVERVLQEYPGTDMDVVLTVPTEMYLWMSGHKRLCESQRTSILVFVASQSPGNPSASSRIGVVFEPGDNTNAVQVSVRAYSGMTDRPTTTSGSRIQKVLIARNGKQRGTAIWWSDNRKARKPDPSEENPDQQYWDNSNDCLVQFLTNEVECAPWLPGTTQRVFGVEVLYDEIAI